MTHKVNYEDMLWDIEKSIEDLGCIRNEIADVVVRLKKNQRKLKKIVDAQKAEDDIELDINFDDFSLDNA